MTLKLKRLHPKSVSVRLNDLKKSGVSIDRALVIKRLQQAYDAGTDEKLGACLGVSKNAVANWRRRSPPALDIFVRAANDTGVSLDWLIRGEGQPPPKGITARILEQRDSAFRRALDEVAYLRKGGAIFAAADQIHRGKPVFPPEIEAEQEFVGIRRYDDRLAAGDGAFNERADVIDLIPFRRSFIQELGRAPEDLACLEVAGDSMEPTLPDGSLVVVDLVERDGRDGIFAFVHDDLARVKRLRFLVDGVEIISDNAVYTPQKIAREDWRGIEIIGRVRWVGYEL